MGHKQINQPKPLLNGSDMAHMVMTPLPILTRDDPITSFYTRLMQQCSQ